MAYYEDDVRDRSAILPPRPGVSVGISRAGVEVGNATFGYAPAAIGAVAGLAGAGGGSAALVAVLAVPMGASITAAMERDALEATERMFEHPFIALGAAAGAYFAGWWVARRVTG